MLEPAPYVALRRNALPAALAALDCDVIALQEIYEQEDQDHLSRAFALTHPHVERGAGTTRLRLGSGLLVLSRFPCRSRFVPFRDAFVEERALGIKGVLVVELAELTLVVTHTSAGGLWRHPESEHSDRVRDAQISQLLELAAHVRSSALLVGDMNAGPGVSDANYRRFARAGWIDVFAHVHPTDRTSITWDPKNPNNVGGWHGHCPPQRIDHMFARSTALSAGTLTVQECAIVLDEPRVTTLDRTVTVSDHAGLLVDVLLR